MSDEEMDPRDQLAQMRAILDQAKSSLPELLQYIFAYYRSAIEAGFSEEDALMLTVDYQRMILSMSWGAGE